MPEVSVNLDCGKSNLKDYADQISVPLVLKGSALAWMKTIARHTR